MAITKSALSEESRVVIMTKELIAEMKELVKEARSNNEILPITEAFTMFPVEDEPHQGKLEYWLEGDKKIEV